MKPSSRFLTSQSISYFGDAILEVAWIVWVIHLAPHHPALSLGTLMALQAVPQAALSGVLAGYIDRLPRKFTLIATSTIRAIAIALTALYPVLWMTFAMVLVFQSVSVIAQPLERAVLPDLVSDRSAINKALARLGQLYSIGQAAGLVLVGGMILVLGIRPVFVVIGAIYLVVAAARGFIAIPPGHVTEKASWWSQIKEGLHFHRDTVAVRYLLILIGMVGLATGGLNMLLALSAPALWHHPTSEVNYLFLALLLGVLASDTILEKWLTDARYHLTILLSIIILMVALLAIGIVSGQWIFGLAMAFLIGVANGFVMTPSRAWLASIVPTEIRGRVAIFRSQVLGIVNVVSPYLTALLVGRIGLTKTWLVVGLLFVPIAIWWLIKKKTTAQSLVPPEPKQAIG